MKISLVFCFLLLTCLYVTLAQGAYENCCLRYVKRISMQTRAKITKYQRQETDGGCNVPAILFSIKKGRKLCADPRKQWVQNLLKIVDTKIQAKKRTH